ncbi:heme lyase CcmF/NrfE family subunit [Brevibacillus ginsengisoli]|uniref:heme lyase CcmF/NrfE family subunit n=1 Tax=Brevibacillus ginsengisoli TaxID=363854 RepID=UPI003CFA5F16
MYWIGNGVIYAALGFAVYAFVASVIGIRKKDAVHKHARIATMGMFASTAVAIGIMLYLLGSSQFQYEYVSHYTNADLPMMYKLSALWAGNAGSLLLWTFLLALYTTVVFCGKKLKDHPVVPYATAILLVNSIFFLFMLGFITRPFALLDKVPVDGSGLNPLLQNPGMVIHPVTLYLGYVGMAIPFAFGMGSLLMKSVKSEWIQMTRRWTLAAWLFLTLGNILGGQWAYVELGWGGYWAWDAVENASFMPWLTATAFMHSVMVQERKNMLRVWNLSLITVTYALTLFGTYIARSGVLTSVHAFPNSSLGNYFLVFMGLAIIFAVYMMMNRINVLKGGAGQFHSYLSKESSFLVNNLLLVGAAIAVLWGTVFPLTSEFLTGNKITLDTSFFNTVEAPILLGLMALMSVCPLLAWNSGNNRKIRRSLILTAVVSTVIGVLLYVYGIRQLYPLFADLVVIFMISNHGVAFYQDAKSRQQSTGEAFVRSLGVMINKNRRRYGGYIVHLGIAAMALGIIGSSNFSVQTMQTIEIGKSITINDYTLTYENLREKPVGHQDVVFADMTVTKNNEPIGTVQPEVVFYDNWEQPSTEVALLSFWKEDLYVVLSAWEPDGKATFTIKVNPMMNWLWIGGIIVTIGTLFAMSASYRSTPNRPQDKGKVQRTDSEDFLKQIQLEIEQELEKKREAQREVSP